MGGRHREKEKEVKTDTERHTHTHPHTQRERERKDTHTEREREREREREKGGRKGGQSSLAAQRIRADKHSLPSLHSVMHMISPLCSAYENCIVPFSSRIEYLRAKTAPKRIRKKQKIKTTDQLQ